MSDIYRSSGLRRSGVLRALSKSSSLKAILLSGASLTLAAGLAGPAHAQAAAPASSPDQVEEVVVTGTQVLRNGFSSPTPLTVVGTADIEASSPINLSDYLDHLPSLAGSASPRNTANSVSDGNGGVAAVNLRFLGANRTLVLFDGMRVGPSSENGATTAGEVDIDEFPDQLVKRVDVVTGGASAQYGSDALAGVVNFILDKDYTGIKGTLDGGVTTYGDDLQYAASLTGGMGFLGGRGHVLFSASDHYTAGVLHGSSRSWVTNNAYDLIATPGYTATNGLPFYTVSQHVGSGLYTPGGLIENTALMGTEFGANGTPSAFNYGALDSGNGYMIGGNYQETYPALTDSGEQYSASLDDRLSRQNIYGRLSYDITDHLEVFGSYMWSNTNVASYCCVSDELVTINSGNPFIPAAVQAAMTAQKISSFQLGVFNQGLGASGPRNQRQKEFYNVGASGDFDLLGSNWVWNVFASKSVSGVHDQAINSPVTATYAKAVNVVTNPKTGYPICASTLITPTDGCVPYDPFGVNVNSAAANAYALGGTSDMRTSIKQDDFGGVLRGNPFSIWAGEVSVSTGIEHRNQGSSGVSSATDVANGFFLGNYHPTIGSYAVTEGFVEAVVPLAHNYSWADELDVNLAVRETGYTVSGNVTTYKIGATYDAPGMMEGFRLRSTLSRDIRAPSLGDLYSGGRVGQGAIIDPFNNNASVPNILTPTLGNPKLRPEVADQTGLGAVYSPPWIPGLSASVDYFRIDMKNVIASTTAQNEINACYTGNTAYCPFIARNAAGAIQTITVAPANTAFLKESGTDFEASYSKDLNEWANFLSGTMSLRGLATDLWEQTSIDPLGNVTYAAHASGVPHWTYNLTAGYDAGLYAITVTGRGLGSSVRNRNYTQCTSGCPTLTAPFYTINSNYLPGEFYMDVNVTYRIKSWNSEVFVSAENVANNNPDNFFVGNNNPLYDRLGRIFRTGIRFNM